MEIVYFYDAPAQKEMDKLLDDDFFKRIGPTVRDCKSMGFERDGYYIYIKARDDLVEDARELLSGSPADPLTGDEADLVVQAFRDEAESAEAGMGTLFG